LASPALRVCAIVWKIIRAILWAGVLGVLIVSGTTSAVLAGGKHGEPDRHRYLLRGIDVSHYQGNINWRAVANDHVTFAYVKATEGVDGRDAEFARNWRSAQRAGIRVGAYHVFVFCQSGRVQAINFLAVVPRLAGTLPPAVDLETARGCQTPLTGAEMSRELRAYLSIVEAHQRKQAVLYVTPRFFATYRDYLPNRRMWRRAISSKPAPNQSWTFWQYRSRGHVRGIRTNVDLNVFRAKRRTVTL